MKKPGNYNDLHICSFSSLTRRLLFIIHAFIFSSILGPVRLFPDEIAYLIPQVCVDGALNRLVERVLKNVRFGECASPDGFVRTAANVRVRKYGSLKNT